MQKLLLALAVMLSASVATDALGRRRNNGDCSPCATKCAPCAPKRCVESQVIGGEEWIEYEECEIPVQTFKRGFKPVKCHTTTVCEKNPCGGCMDEESFQAEYAGKIRGPYKAGQH